jgi:single-strand DNA-binding protein
MGNLARDPEVRYTSGKQAVANIPLAVNRTWKDKNGELQESVDFIPVAVWGSTA